MIGWTPDGSGIVFLSDRSGTRDLYLLGIENGRPRGDPRVAAAGFRHQHESLPDSRRTALPAREHANHDSFIVPVDEQTGKLTGSPSPVDANFPTCSAPNWSPDGKIALFTQIYKLPADELSRWLFIRSEATGETREITPKPKLSYMWNPLLSPDGRRFAVSGIGENKNRAFSQSTWRAAT